MISTQEMDNAACISHGMAGEEGQCDGSLLLQDKARGSYLNAMISLFSSLNVNYNVNHLCFSILFTPRCVPVDVDVGTNAPDS